jgi:glycosyltransferase involved in cell wall biosynthesis
MLATGEGASPPADGMAWIFATALSCCELNQIRPRLDRGLATPPHFVYVGRLSPEKGVANLVQATAALKNAGFKPLPVLTLIGDGPQRQALEVMVRNLGCESQIHFAGQLCRHELSRRLLQADVCVQPSLTEGYSKAWLDAMAHGVPVLASEVGAARSVVYGHGERGWLVPAGDVQALVEMIRNVVTEPIDWRALRQRCRSFVEDRTLETWGQQIGQLCAQQWNLSLVGGKLSP